MPTYRSNDEITLDMQLGDDTIAVSARQGGPVHLKPNLGFEDMRGFVQLVLELEPQQAAELRGLLAAAEVWATGEPPAEGGAGAHRG